MPANRLKVSLLLLRLGVFLVMAVWTIDKFVNPVHAAKVYENFYFIGGLGATIMYVVGALEAVVILGFLLGMYKRFTYGFVLIVHGISTLSSFKMYLSFEHLLFFAAWPMLAACAALYLLRDQDTMWTVGRKGVKAT